MAKVLTEAYSPSTMAQPSRFARIGDFALFLVGALMSAAGVFVVAEEASRVVLFLLGAGLMVIGALLPRLSGTIKISPGAVELTVIQQLEATRLEAERHVPDRVEEAVGLAFQRLVESGVLAGIPMQTRAAGRDSPPPAPSLPPSSVGSERPSPHVDTSAGEEMPASVPASTSVSEPLAPAPPSGAVARAPRGGSVGLALAVALLLGVAASGIAWGFWTTALWALATGASVLVVGGLAALVVRRRTPRRTRLSAPAESPDAFARRIVEEMVRRPGARSL